jgi:glutathione S-transferase
VPTSLIRATLIKSSAARATQRPSRSNEVDILKGENRTTEFKDQSQRPPVLDDNGFILAESNAILAYLAKGTKFLPGDRQKFADIPVDALRAIQP